MKSAIGWTLTLLDMALSEYGAGSDLPAAIARIIRMPLAHLFLLHRSACARHEVQHAGMSYVVRDMVDALRAGEEEEGRRAKD